MVQGPLKNLRYDALVFDFDGVLVDSEEIKVDAFASLYSEDGPEIVQKVVEYHRANFGVSRLLKFKYFEETLLRRRYTPEAGRSLARRFSEMVEEKVVEAPWVPGAREFLESYGKVLPLYVASGTPDEEIRRITAKRGILHFFKAVYGSPPGKAELLERIVREGVFRRERVLMIGDARADYEGARKAGVSFLGCSRGGDSLPAPTIADLTSLEKKLFEKT
ncbi:MAG: HAD family hydrolase [Candidatus Omnitrophica bacterium]|nr:HAD family hydrolase [Candidatus Omnitrophota bacterium]